MATETAPVSALRGSDGIATVTNGGGVTVWPLPSDPAGSREWRHPKEVAGLLANGGAIDLGDRIVESAEEAREILKRDGRRDARNALRAELLAAILNVRNGVSPEAGPGSVGAVIDDATAFLAQHPDRVKRGHPDRAAADRLIDLLHAFNSGDDD